MGRPQRIQKIAPALWRIMQRFWPYLRRERRLAFGAVAALLAQVFFRILEPWPLKFIFDHLFSTAPSGASGPFEGIGTNWLLGASALALVIIVGLRALTVYWSKVGFALVGQKVLANVRSELFQHLQYLSLRFHKKARRGDLVVRLMGDVGLIREVMVTAFLPLAANVLVLAGMASLMLWLNWQLTLLALTTVPLFWFNATRIGKRIHEVAREQRERRSRMTAVAVDSIDAIETVQALSLHPLFSNAFNSQDKRSVKQGVKAKRLAARLQRTVAVLVALSTALVLFFGARMVLSGSMTPGDLLVFLAYLKSAFRPAQSFAKYMGRLAKAVAAGERILEILDQAPEVRDLPGAAAAPAFKGALRLENVSFSYDSGKRALRQVTLSVAPGRNVAIVGPSGAGKSTLISLLLRLYDPLEGRVLVDGVDVRSYTLESLRAQFSMVLQDTVLFATSVRENITAGLPDVTEEDIRSAAELANATDFIESLPEGFDTVLGERGVTLSKGQRQRIAIARAALKKASILILDEPTTGLDEENSGALIGALERLARDRTTIIISHDLRFGLRADQILYLERGRLLEEGSHDELTARQGRYSQLYQQQLASLNSKVRNPASNPPKKAKMGASGT